MADVLCVKCRDMDTETFWVLVRHGRLAATADPHAICFLRNDDGEGGSLLEPVCQFHKGECVTTVVPYDDGIGEYMVQEVMGS